jgi:hypothetical protein
MSPTKPSPPGSHSSSLETAPGRGGAALRRVQTGVTPRSNSPWTEALDHESGSGGDEYDEDEIDEREWGLEKGMELFEVSAKDDVGTSFFFPFPFDPIFHC